MLKKSYLVLFLLIWPVSSFADISTKEYAKCAIIDGDLSRLECFDNLAADKSLDGLQQEATIIADKGKWNVSVDLNPIDDSKTVSLILGALSGKGKYGDTVVLVAQCKSNKTDLYISWGSYLGRETKVLSRIGTNKAVTRTWALSTDSKATFHRKPISFIKGMMKSTKLIAQITPYNENPVTAVFETEGLENAIKPLRETCNW